MAKKLHIISFDIPYPANYGGVMDVYWKIHALHRLGVKVILHCFFEDRVPADELEEICEKVYYYPRKSALASLPFFYPYMAFSRRSKELLQNLAKDEYPILIEGLQNGYCLKSLAQSKKRKIWVRMHNNEWEYYSSLAKSESHLFTKMYLYWEAFLLKRFEKILQHADKILAISLADTVYFGQKFPNVSYLPAFHPYQKLLCKEGKGDFMLYHGNLAIAENHEAALFIIEQIAHKIHFPIIIAGANPRAALIEAVASFPHIQLIINPNMEEMEYLIQTAHIHLLPTFQATGIKLKLLHALFTGRFVLVNPEMIVDTGLEILTRICKDANEFILEIEKHISLSFTTEEIEKRQNILFPLFDNAENAKKLWGLWE